MSRLWVRLTLAFALVTATGVLVVALLANRSVGVDFRHFMVAQGQPGDATLMAQLADYYGSHDGWAGVEGLLGATAAARRGMMMGRGGPMLTLADAGGQVYYDDMGATGQLAPQDLEQAAPIVWQGRTVGYLLARGMGGADMGGAGQRFLAQVNTALLQAGLVAGGLGALLGLLIARGLAAPLGRLAEAARRLARGELDQRVAPAGSAEVVEVGRAFNEMAESLQRAELLRRNMVADIAHELRTPLSVIQGNLRALLDDVYPLEKAEIATIYDETIVLGRLIGDLRDLAQAEAGQLGLAVAPTPAAPLVEAVAALFAEPAAARQVGLAVELTPGLPPLLADADRVRQVLHNLLSNALRYTPPGGRVVVRVTSDDRPTTNGQRPTANGRTAVAARRRASNAGYLTTAGTEREAAAEMEHHVSAAPIAPSAAVRFEVIDSGPGIAEQDLPHVFERFWRADHARSRERGGSGLGLAIVRQLVEAQGGRIGVERAEGGGSRFWFTLPACVSASAMDAAS